MRASLVGIFAVMSMMISCPAVAADTLKVTAKNGDQLEIALRDRVEYVVAKYRLQRWMYTKLVIVDKNTWPPHSHPVITLGVNERFVRSDIELVAALLHEQFHWNMSLHSRLSPRQSLLIVKRFLPALRTASPYGSDDELSTYGHVPVCYMEYRALSGVFGRGVAQDYLSRQPFYTDVYAAVLDEGNAAQIEAVLTTAGVTY